MWSVDPLKDYWSEAMDTSQPFVLPRLSSHLGKLTTFPTLKVLHLWEIKPAVR
jgi:hypothetical protein